MKKATIDRSMRRLIAGKRPQGATPMIGAKHPGTPVRFVQAPHPEVNLFKRTDSKRVI